MKYCGIFAFAVIAAVGLGQVQTQRQPASNVPVAVPTQALGQALDEIAFMVPLKWIKRLIVSYLLTDSEFQAVVRALNSPDAASLWMRLRQQPELFMFRRWVKQQLQLSKSSADWDDSLELSLIDTRPYWVQILPGWQGLLTELSYLIAPEQIRQQIQLKVSQGGPIAQWWQKLQALGVVYDRALRWPETTRVLQDLRQLGCDVNAVDRGVRGFFGWPNATQVAVGGAGAAAGAARAPNGWRYY